MNHMSLLVWLLPVIFMIHDFEEIIMLEVWENRYGKEINILFKKRKPFGLNNMKVYQTATFSIGVEVEFILFSLISLLSAIYQSYFLWFAAFLGVVLHMIVVHIVICFKFKHYVPGIITSILLVLPSIYCLYMANRMLSYRTETILLSCLIGIVLMLILIPVLHKGMRVWSKWLEQYSKHK